jgi:hypothetical protein
VFDRPWTNDRASLLHDIDAALSGPFETTADCSRP